MICSIGCCFATVYNFETEGATPNDESLLACNTNAAIFNKTLGLLKPGDILLIPMNLKFWIMGGIYGANLINITIQIDGELHYWDERDEWPTDDNGNVKQCMYFWNIKGLTLTSQNRNKGLIDGHGQKWWGAIDYGIWQENRPRLLMVENSNHITIFNIFFKDSPYWNVYLNDVAEVEISFSNVSAKRTGFYNYFFAVFQCLNVFLMGAACANVRSSFFFLQKTKKTFRI